MTDVSLTFSILKRIGVGETFCWPGRSGSIAAFSILKRIGVGETTTGASQKITAKYLSVSSNGSEWVKPIHPRSGSVAVTAFQYPQTDRSG